ncbi:MlaC/ttg2D family ABC transporter substrate-binding protein [Marinovum sp.]|uniref:MlaC/ttg2D family ABC transporter substrate-binding protein n=1 Tax=Marinovum sp. TaxID=2024839 RepID=UPI003A8FF361
MLRRQFLTTAAAVALYFAARPALALTMDNAKALVDALVADIARASGTADFEGLFKRYADVPGIAGYVLGLDGRNASAAQKRDFQEAFTGYVARKYGPRLRDFTGGRIEVTEVRQVKSFHEVSCSAHLPGAAPQALDFTVSDAGGRELIFNLKIGGVNLLLTERTEIGSMIDRRGGDLDAMIADLRGAG